MYLSYSGYKTEDACPRDYYHKYIGKTPLAVPENRVHMLYGDVVGKLFELFYSERLWRHADVLQRMLDRAPLIIEKTVAKETAKGGVFNWKEPKLKPGTRSLDEVRGEILDTIPRGLEIIRTHRLLGRDAAAELKLDTAVERHTLGGRADFVIRRHPPQSDLTITDGKGSRWRDTYVDRRQLKWYAMLYWEKFGVLPDLLGFLYWRSVPENSADWVHFTKDDVASLRDATLQTVGQIEAATRRLPVVGAPSKELLAEIFPARPSRDCVRCNFLAVCDEGKARMSATAPMPTGLGVEDISL